MDITTSNTETNGSFFVCINANARRGPYRIDTAPDIATIDRERRCYMRDISGPGDIPLRNVFFTVWLEECENQAAAKKRAAEIRATPRPWQRRLVELLNPCWCDYTAVLIGFPPEFINSLPEKAGMPFSSFLAQQNETDSSNEHPN